MKLVAQRVMQPVTRAQAIHAFHYTHGPRTWPGAPPKNIGNGKLEVSRIELPAGSNDVLSYLDIIAPDETPTSKILQAFAKVYDMGKAPPFRITIGNCTFESNMVHAFRLAWRQELVTLFNAAIPTRITILSS